MSLLADAQRIAEEFADKYKNQALGIIFTGALARNYFDKFADIDIVIIGKKSLPMVKSVPRNGTYKGFVIDYWTTTLSQLMKQNWSMPMRWAFSEAVVYHDTKGTMKKLIKEKARFLKSERKSLMIEGIIQSEWFCSTLPEVWAARDDIVSAHGMFDKGVQHFFEALFSYNNRLVPYEKWRLNYARALPWLPKQFENKLKEIYLVRRLDKQELDRRKRTFMYLWKQLEPRIVKETKMTLKEMDALV